LRNESADSLTKPCPVGRPRTIDLQQNVAEKVTAPPKKLGVINWSSQLLALSLSPRQTGRRLQTRSQVRTSGDNMLISDDERLP
jgi:hypothetical protein